MGNPQYAFSSLLLFSRHPRSVLIEDPVLNNGFTISDFGNDVSTYSLIAETITLVKPHRLSFLQARQHLTLLTAQCLLYLAH